MSPAHPRYIVLEKTLGQTPLRAIDAWKHAHPAYAEVPATYAGRLDPMAEGVLLVLLGDECKRKDAYLGLDKEYEIEVLLDLATDTGDVLGMPAYAGIESNVSAGSLRSLLRAEIGSKDIPYPAYSSKAVAGKPLFMHALEGTLGTIEIPTHAEVIYRIQDRGCETLAKAALAARIERILARAPRTDEPSRVLGRDFRQDQIRDAWKDTLDAMPDRTFAVVTLRVACASGSYMRSLAERIGAALGTSAAALSIRRTRIGRYRDIFGIGFWTALFR